MDEVGAPGRGRRSAAWVLLVVAVLLTPITIATRWVSFEITSEERFVNTLGPLAEDPQVQQAVADRVTQIIFEQVDVAALAQDALPDRADFLAAPLAAGVESFTNEQALRLLQSEQFAELWEDALRVAHRAADALLTGKDEGAVQVQDGQVVLDLSTIVQAVVDRLADRGLTFVESLPTDAVSGEIVLFESTALADAQALVGLLNTLSWVLLVVALVCFAASVLVLGDRRRGLVRVGVGLGVGALLLGVGLAFGRGAYLDAVVAAGADRTVQEIVFDQVVSSLRTTVRAVVVLGVVLALVSWSLGPSRPATRLRAIVGAGLGRGARGAAGAGVGDQAVLRWMARYERVVQAAVLVVAAAVFLFWTQPTAATVLAITLVVVLVLAVVSVLARAASTQHPARSMQEPEGKADDEAAGAEGASERPDRDEATT